MKAGGVSCCLGVVHELGNRLIGIIVRFRKYFGRGVGRVTIFLVNGKLVMCLSQAYLSGDGWQKVLRNRYRSSFVCVLRC